ncbi:molybdopterin molybdenumtransferase MoeA, partial [Micromonospora sp. 4G55]|nr:molybdopterin molybdenumtransferase MoeA [Micromonospora sp. 4G55]
MRGAAGAALVGQLREVRRQLVRPSVRAHLLETITSPGGLREFRPAHVAERRGG